MTHRDAPVTCSACGKRVPRKGRLQAYCSRRCRQRAYWDRKAVAKISTIVTHDTGVAESCARTVTLRDAHIAGDVRRCGQMLAQRESDHVLAARSLPYPFTLTARAENYLWERPDLEDTIRAVCTTLTRDLTPEERIQFDISDQNPTCPAQ